MNPKTAKAAKEPQRPQNFLCVLCGVIPLKLQRILRFCDNGITLLELLIAISLLLLVLAAAMSVDMAGQWFFKTISMQAEIQDELQPGMEHIVKNIQQSNSINVVSQTEVNVTIVDNNDTPYDRSDDTFTTVTYRKDTNPMSNTYNNILYSDSVSGITDEPIGKDITNNDIFSPFPFNGIFLNIKMVGERVIQGSTESATLISGVTLRCRRAG